MTGGSSLPAHTEILPDADALVRAASDRIVAALAAASGPRVSFCLSGGSTPRRVYEALAASPRGAVDWSRVHLFWGDERLVGPEHADSNEHMARDALVAGIPIPPENVHPIVTSGRSAEEAAAGYESVLRSFRGDEPLSARRPLFDVTLLGLGEDGHTASLFPGSPAVDETGRWVAPVETAGQPPYIPRVTLTRPALASSRLSLFLVSGAAKHGPLSRVGAGEPLPSAIVARESPAACWLVDRAAATGDTA